MFRILAIAIAVLLAQQTAHAAAISVTPSERYQKIIGIGGGIPYKAQQEDLANHPNRTAIYDTLFSSARVSFIRTDMKDTVRGWTDKYPYNCYGKINACTTSIRRSTWGPLRSIVKAGESRLGYRPLVFMSNWSPPARFKASGSRDGGYLSGNKWVVRPRKQNTLKKINGRYAYAEVAQWMRKSLESFRDTMGFFPDYISIQNEPWTNVAYGSCNFAPTENDSIAGYAQFLQAVHDTLKRAHPGLEKNLAGPEVEGLGYKKDWSGDWQEYASAYIGKFLNPNHVSSYAFHFYGGGSYSKPNDWAYFTRSISKYFPIKPLIMSENANQAIDNNDSAKYRKAKLIGLSHTLAVSLTSGNLSAYINWEMIWNGGQMINIGVWNNRKMIVYPEYHATRHFSRYVQPGWVRIGSTTSDVEVPVAAFSSPKSDTIALIAVNITPKAKVLALPNIPGYAMKAAFRSNAASYSQNLTLPTTNTMGLPDSSVVTFQYIRKPNKAPTLTVTNPILPGNLTAPAAFTISVSGSDADGKITSIELLKNNMGYLRFDPSIAAQTVATSFAVKDLPKGTYEFKARVTDDLGVQSYGSAFNVTVNDWDYKLLFSMQNKDWYGGLSVAHTLPKNLVKPQIRITNKAIPSITSTQTIVPGSLFTKLIGIYKWPTGNYAVEILSNGVKQTSVSVSKAATRY